ncbi:AAA family ATPase [Pedobacter panaciterrae]
MLNLKFHSQYLSVHHFEPIDIGDLSIITGLNGSGKTHFLKAINSGAIIVDGLSSAEVVYYNYEDFKVNSKDRVGNGTGQARNMEFTQHGVSIVQKANQVKQNAISFLNEENRSPLDQILISLAQHSYYNSLFDEPEDIKVFEKMKRKANYNDVYYDQFSSLFSPVFNGFIESLLSSGIPLEDVNVQNSKAKMAEYRTYIEHSVRNQDKDLEEYLKRHDKDIFSFHPGDFEVPSFLLEEITNEEKNYQVLYAQNMFANFKAINFDGKESYYSKEEFVRVHGVSPVERINEVLREYDCNGYQLYASQHEPHLGQQPNDIQVQVQLHNSIGSYYTSFEQLSSGEQTLIALSLLIYKSRKKIIPRLLLLDEIDSSLHPSMIKRLLSVIENVFIDKLQLKVIMATHSPTTVALCSSDVIYIVNRTGVEKLTPLDKGKAIGILTEGFAALSHEDSSLGIAYNIERTPLPVLFTEGITDKIILEEAWKKLNPSKLQPFYIQDCFDAAFLGNLFRRGHDKDGIFTSYPDRVFIGLFDFDHKGYNEWKGTWGKEEAELIESDPKNCLTKSKGNGYLLLLPVPDQVDVARMVLDKMGKTFEDRSMLTIEHLFYGLEDLENCFIIEAMPGNGSKITLQKNKKSFALSLQKYSADNFKAFQPLFDMIIKLIINR